MLQSVKFHALVVACATAFALGGCAADGIKPAEAVQQAAAAAPAGVSGVFPLTVQATGSQDGFIYLNSELDYRDQRNLSIALTAKAAQQLQAQLGSSPEVALKGHRIIVSGVAKRVTIRLSQDGKPTDKYYYQTHVLASDARQIELAGS
jgi:hypothetical protein